jgi:hypothetical protein
VIYFRQIHDIKDPIEFHRKPNVNPGETNNKVEEGGHRTWYEVDPTTSYLTNTIKKVQASTYTHIEHMNDHANYMPPKLTTDEESDNDTIDREDEHRKDTPENDNNYKCYVHKKFRTLAEYSHSSLQIMDNRYIYWL